MRNFTKLIIPVLLGILLLGFSTLNLKAQCNASFGYIINAPSVTFVAQDSTPQKYHFWSFGDGSTGSGYYLVSHTYNQPGQYMVTHFISDSINNCRDSSVQMVTVNFAATCQAYFAYYPLVDSLISNQYYFYNLSTPSGSSFVKSNVWSINGAPADSSSSSLNYTFTQPGTYNVCLSIETYAGCSSQYCQQVVVYGYCKMGASFTYHADSLYPASVTFYPQPNLANVEYKWRINGNLFFAQTPVAQFYQSGSYPATLYMLDTVKQCYDSSAGTFTVPVFPCDTIHATFNYRIDSKDSALVYFTAKSNDSIIAQTWSIYPLYNYSDSALYATLNTNNPAYRFADTGFYEVCLQAGLQHCGMQESCNAIQIISTGKAGSADRLTSYPNPASNNVGIDVPLAADGTISVNVYNSGGTRVLTLQQAGVSGTNHINIPVQQLNKGQYFVDIITGTVKHRSVFQKF